MGLYDRDYIQDSRLQGTFASRVYGWMTAGLAVTTFFALGLYFTGLYKSLFSFWWIWCFATLGVSFFINAKIQKLSLPAVMGLFIAYSALEGMFFGTLLPVYAIQYGGGVIWAAFGSAALVFGLAALYGAFTKNDLTKISKIMMFALIGLMLVTVVFAIISIFISMPLVYLLICYLGLVIFVGLTAADAQAIRRISTSVDNNSVLSYKLSLIMALKMYCNVIMVFWYLLQIFSSSGNRK
ncbi:Bax inhibitor-1/YccA family protein [Candidatus Chlamydia sanziniae]|uniref:Membrane protein n=1 Tax=Candidatus Chlamydia sanziniae TaxID=1806891 RepID=A0A1A9HXJ7_9CHLA|nr:Bax inhibitor-1/YccA family protein [Candidatus Chlamydia sanziniae]ANH78764.1 membrane protein [Candidatus Chlamydia sanziniae]